MPEPMTSTSETPAQASTEIEVFPAKHFFVDSLTRDIDLADAILDLLDNCVDGARRMTTKPEDGYAGYSAEIHFDKNGFSIKDNCGGISLDEAKNSAFRFGRPSEYVPKADGTIGVIGIGMKRAILKMGRSAIVHSHHKDDSFEVRITPTWLDDDKDWKLYFEKVTPKLESFGTKIEVTELTDSVKEEFESAQFKKKLFDKVSSAFSLLTERGFGVTINDQAVKGQIPTLLWQDNEVPGATVIRPYLYRDIIDGVEIYLAVGFREPDKETQTEDDTRRYYSSVPAGWTVACNDRVVLYCDKSEQTGWGTGRVPEYHTQFIRISGFAEFRCPDTSKLPFTTTKQGVNQQAKVFLRVFDAMRDGTKIFTDWTNQFSEYSTQKEEVFTTANARSASVEEIKTKTEAPKIVPNGNPKVPPIIQKPKLPKPKTERKEKTISFKRPEFAIRAVSQFISNNEDERPSKVGEQCFDYFYEEAKK